MQERLKSLGVGTEEIRKNVYNEKDQIYDKIRK